MFIVISVKSDHDVELQKRIFDRETWGYSQKYHVEAEGEVFLTRTAAEAWIDDCNKYRRKNNMYMHNFEIKEV